MYGLAERGLFVKVGIERSLFGSSSFIKFTVSYYTPTKTSISYTRAFAGADLTDISDPAVIIDLIIAEMAASANVQTSTLQKWLDGSRS